MAARTFAVFPRRPRKTFKLGRFRPTDGFARQVHDPPQNLERPGAPGALRRRDPSFARGHCGLPCISGTTRTERPQIATGAALVLSGCWWGVQRPSRTSQAFPTGTAPRQSTWSTHGGQKCSQAAAFGQAAVFARLKCLESLPLAVNGTRKSLASRSSGPTGQPLESLLGPPGGPIC